MEIKKKPEQDLRKRKMLFSEVGLAVSLGLMLAAFTLSKSEVEEIEEIKMVYNDESEVINPIDMKKPPPPPPQDAPPPERPPELEQVKDDEEDDDPNKLKKPEGNKAPPKALPPKQEDLGEEEILDFAQTMPEFPGGMDKLQVYVLSNFQMPAEAIEVEAEGKIYVAFVVGSDGRVRDIEVLKDGVGWGCAEEAVRVLKKMAKEIKWKPGEQLNKKVTVRYRYPIVIRQN